MMSAILMQIQIKPCFGMAMRKIFWRFIGGTNSGISGLAATEFAIAGPVLVLMMICVMDLGLGIYRKMQVQSAAQAGAQYAMIHGFNESAVLSAVASATTFSGINASPAPSQFCGCISNNRISSISCSSTCSGGSSPGTYVTVSTQGTYNTIISYPVLPTSYNFVAQSTVRIQ